MWPSAPAIAESTAITSAIHHFTPFFSSMLFEIVKRMNGFPGSRRQVPEGVLSFCSSCIYTPRGWPMHTPASTKVLKKILGVKWALGGRVVGLNLLLTIPASRICQIFGVSAASRVRQFHNHLGFSPRGQPRREMRQRCGVVSTSKSRPLVADERHAIAAPPPASLSNAAASAASVLGCTAASVAIKSGRVSGLRRRWYQPRQRHPRQRHPRRRHPRQRQSRQRQSRQRHPRRRHSRRKGEGKRGQGGRAAWAGKEKTRACGCRRVLAGHSLLRNICPQVSAKLPHSPEISKSFVFF